jgi:peptide chain release factor 1
MLDKLADVERRFEELNVLLSDPEVTSDPKKYSEYAKEHSDLNEVVKCYRVYQKVCADLKGAKELVSEAVDPEMRELAALEVEELQGEFEELESALYVLLAPKDPNDDKNIIMELRAGAGGDESALFAEDLFSLYTKYAEQQRWKVEIMDSSASSVGGFKEIIAQVTGQGAYSRFKYESGVHRVQRVPKTETQGRIHTSTVTVAVLPEAEDIEIDIQEKDLRVDVFRASGPGGQSVNTTDSAVRITHLPTGIVATCQDGKSQHKNKDKALRVLKARIFDKMMEEQMAEIGDNRRSQIGSGMRAEKVRTYNFPQGRITDHRIGLTLYQLDTVMSGDLDLVIDPLNAHYTAEAMKGEE